MPIVLRTTKGAPLSFRELDENFNELDQRLTVVENQDNTTQETFSRNYEDLFNKPELFSGDYLDLDNKPAIPNALTDLSNVSNIAPTTGQVLKWNGTSWVPGDETVDTDAITLAGEGAAYYLNYNNFINTPGIPRALADLINVSSNLPTTGQVLKWNGSQWAPSADDAGVDGGGIALTDLSLSVNSPSGSGNLTYSNVSGVFTYTPPDLTPYATTASLSAVATSGAYSDLTDTPTLFSGSYTDLTDKPILFDGDYNKLTNTPTLFSGSYNDLTETPTLFDGDYNSLTNTPTAVSAFTNDAGYLTTETTTVLSIESNILSYVDEAGNTTNIDLSLYLDDTNLARVASGTVDAEGIATFTRDDATTFSVDFSTLLNVTLADLSVGAAAAPSGNGGLSYNNTSGVFIYTPPDLTPYATTASLATVATSGAYADLTGTPNIPEDISELTDTTSLLFSRSYNDLTETPTIPSDVSELTDTTNLFFSRSYDDLTDTPTIPASITDLNIVDGSNGQVLTTDGAGSFSFTTITAGSAIPSRTTVSGTTASLANGSTDNVNITGFKAYSLMAIQTSGAAWVRVYANAASRTADASRAETTDPAPDAGVIAEVITAGAETVLISPGVFGFNFESPVTDIIPVAITNKTGSTAAITATLTVLQMEA